MQARKLGGTAKPLPPYAVRVDIPRYEARRIIDATKGTTDYALQSLRSSLVKVLTPYYSDLEQ